jgi:HPt (histidine-containing phosphotransfer) domain-containing protein
MDLIKDIVRRMEAPEGETPTPAAAASPTSTSSASQAAPTPAPDDTAHAAPGPLSGEQPSLHSVLESNPRLHRVIGKFVVRMQSQTPEFDAALNAGNFDTLAALAHWLKGAAGTVGFHAFTEPAQELENAAKASNLNQCRVHVATIKSLAERMTGQSESESKTSATP